MTGRLGLELMPQQLTDKEKTFTKEVVKIYKQIRPVIQFGDLYQIWSPWQEGDWSSSVYVSKDKSEAVFFAFSLDYHARTVSAHFKLQGLDKDKTYKIVELNNSGQSSFIGNNRTFTGDFLMNAGIRFNIYKRGSSAVFLIKEN